MGPAAVLGLVGSVDETVSVVTVGSKTLSRSSVSARRAAASASRGPTTEFRDTVGAVVEGGCEREESLRVSGSWPRAVIPKINKSEPSTK
jgi:hypothetical protein